MHTHTHAHTHTHVHVHAHAPPPQCTHARAHPPTHASARRYGKPALSRSVSPEYHKWIDPGITLLCQGLGVALAWMLQRVISALHCAVRGAHIVITQSQKAAVKLGFIAKPFLTEDSPVFSLAVMLLAAAGFLNQVQYGFSMPRLLQPFFLPMYAIEFVLTQTIGSV